MRRRRPGLIIPSPGFPLTAMWISAWTIILLIGIPVIIRFGFKMKSWADFFSFMPFVLGGVVVLALVVGLFAALRAIVQKWAWRRLVEDTPVADDEGS
ncbi:MAG: hypothetical protein ACK4FG_03885 [Brevundimonas sp.]